MNAVPHETGDDAPDAPGVPGVPVVSSEADPTPGGRVLVFANPYSGHRDNRQRVDALSAALAARGLDAEVVWDAGRRDAALKETETEAGPGCRAVVAAGGDGSVNGAVNALARAGRLHVPLATLPVGTENLVAQALGFEAPVETLADALAAGQVRTIDLGVAGTPEALDAGGGHRFVLMLTRGFDAHVVHCMDRWRRAPGGGTLRRVNRFSYAPRILRGLAGYRYPRLRLETDDGQAVEGVQAYVFNLGLYGGGFPLGEHAAPDDGQLDWVVSKRPGSLRLLHTHWLASRRRHLDSPHVAHGRAAGVRITAVDAPVDGQADGDPLPADATDVRVCPGVLRVIRMPSAR